MPIDVPRGLPFAVDMWTPSSALKRHRFLTHAHRDHLTGITTAAAIYATRLTVLITLHYFPQLDRAAFVELEAGAPPLRVPDPDGDFTVTAFDANHCPGAVMFLFEGPFGAVLHTGDCRLTPDCLHALPLLTNPSRRIHYVYLDCTFARCPLQFPTKEDSIRQVINCIWRHPNAPVVYLVCDMLGQEDVLVEVSRTFGSKIHVDGDETPDCHHRLSLLAPEILADNAAASRFHVMAFQRLTKRATEILALARARREPEPLIIRPSSQWYAFYEAPEASLHRRPVLTEPMRDEFGVWHVCLSMHSSRDELEQALGVIRPRWVVSTTPPCMAIDLSYVKKHCSLSRLGPDDCKLLGIADAMSTSVTGSPPQPPMVTVEEAIEKSEVAVTCSVEEFGSDDSSHQVEAAEPAVEGFEIRVEPPLTLFGIARFGLLQNGSQLWKDEYQSGDDVETGGAMESPAEPGLSKDGIGMPEKSVEATEIAEVATTEQNSAEPGLSKYGIGMLEKSVEATEIAEVAATEQNSAEPGLSKDGIGIPEKSVEVTEIAEVAANEQNSDTEAELQNHGKSNGEVQVTDSTDGESMLQSSSTRSELCNEDDKCVEVVKGNGEAELKAQRHGFSLHSDLLTMCRSGVTEQGRNRRKVVEEISDVRITDSAKNNKEAAEDGKKSDRDFGERAGDTSTVNGPSKGLNPNLRRLYRSMNVPVPRPLPSLVELMAASSKRPRVSRTVQL